MKVIWKPWVLNPIWHSLLAWGLTIAAIPLASLASRFGNMFLGLFLVTVLLICTFGVIAVIVSVKTYKTTEQFLTRLLTLYLALILVFSTIYFWIVVLSDPTLTFEGMAKPWHWLGGTEGRRWSLDDAALLAVDCFHYSTVTITTLGFGDMHPVHWITKLLTDFEVLAGVALVAVGLGRFFSGLSNEALRK